MSLIEIDGTRCARDGLCIKECPARILGPGADGVPVVRPEAVNGCLECGHCQAVCPRDALTLRGAAPADLPAAMPGPVEWELMKGIIRSRRSIRHFKPTPVAPGTLDSLLDVTRWAPTGCNSQLVRWLLVERPETMKALSGAVADWARGVRQLSFLASTWDAGYDVILRGAPNLAIAYAGDGYGGVAADCVIAATTLELAASSQGIGACWAGYFMAACEAGYGPLLDLLGLPASEGKVYAALMLGHPLYSFHRVPERRPLRMKRLG